MSAQRGDRAPHNHVTRDVKPRGTCPACDRILDEAAAEVDPEVWSEFEAQVRDDLRRLS